MARTEKLSKESKLYAKEKEAFYYNFPELIKKEFCLTTKYRRFLIDEYERLSKDDENNDEMENLEECSTQVLERWSISLSLFLQPIVGSNEQIRIRNLKSVANRFVRFQNAKVVFTGSRQEGLRMRSSDLDLMIEVPISAQFEESISSRKDYCEIIIHTTEVNPGFAILECISTYSKQKGQFHEMIYESIDTDNQQRHVVSSLKMRQHVLKLVEKIGIPFSEKGMHTHGPCASGGVSEVLEYDITIGLHCSISSVALNKWGKRNRKYNWPSVDIITKALKEGFHLVPIGDKTSSTCCLEWRICFCTIEEELVISFNQTQLHCYVLLKSFLKSGIEINKAFKDILSSYCMKTLMFWVIEETKAEDWVPKNLIVLFKLCVSNYLIPWISNGFFPNYVIPERNILLGRLDGDKKEPLIDFILSQIHGGWDLMALSTESLYFRNNSIPYFVNFRVQKSSPRKPAVIQDIEWEIINDYTYFVELFGSVELPLFLHTMVQKTTQNLEKHYPPNKQSIHDIFQSKDVPAEVENEFIYLCIHSWHKIATNDCSPSRVSKMSKIESFLLERKTYDVSCMRLCLATFYYVQGNYQKAEEIANEVDDSFICVNVISVGLIETCRHWAVERDLKYMADICGKCLPIEEKRTKAMGLDYRVPPGSKLLPQELRIITDLSHPLRLLQLSPILYAQFLIFLCLHRNQMYAKRDEIFSKMHFTIRNRECINYWHHAHFMLGVCCDLQGDLSAALDHFVASYAFIQHQRIWYYEKPTLVRIAMLISKLLK